ncbi:tetratricopeptide repeat protein [Brevibacillus gelatini]
MWDVLASIGFFACILCVIGTVIFAIKRRPLWKKCLALGGLCFVIFVVGVMNIPPDPEKLKKELAASEASFAQGSKALEAKQYEEALTAFQQVAKADTKNYQEAQSRIAELSRQVAQIKLEKAIQLYEAEKYKEAQGLLELVVELDPSIARAHLYLGLVNLYPLEPNTSSYGQVNQAIESSPILTYGDLVRREESIEKNESLHKQAREYIDSMQDAVDSSEKSVTKATELDPNYKEAMGTSDVIRTLELLLDKMDQYHKKCIEIADKHQDILALEKKWKKTWDSGDFKKLDEIDPEIRQEIQEIQEELEKTKAEAASLSEEISSIQKQGQAKMKQMKITFPNL